MENQISKWLKNSLSRVTLYEARIDRSGCTADRPQVMVDHPIRTGMQQKGQSTSMHRRLTVKKERATISKARLSVTFSLVEIQKVLFAPTALTSQKYK